MTANANTYAIVNIQEIKKLQECSLSGLQTRVYMVLCSFSNNKANCFPSLKTIAETLGMSCKSATQQVLRALKVLEDVGLIKRNSKRSKSRFEMITRRAVLTAKKLLKNQTASVSSQPNTCSLHKETNENRTSITHTLKGIEKKKRRSLFTPLERRQRRAERRRQENEEMRQKELKSQELKQKQQQDSHRIAFLSATDSLISCSGAVDNKSIAKLVMARINYENERSNWAYEPVIPSLNDKQKGSISQYIRNSHDTDIYTAMYHFSYGMKEGLSAERVWRWLINQ